MTDTGTARAARARPAPADAPGRAPLLRNAYALMVNTGVSAVLGLGFWVAAARYYSEEAVGHGSAAIAAMKLLAGLTAVTLTGALARFVPVSGAATGALVRRTYAGSALLVAGRPLVAAAAATQNPSPSTAETPGVDHQGVRVCAVSGARPGASAGAGPGPRGAGGAGVSHGRGAPFPGLPSGPAAPSRTPGSAPVRGVRPGQRAGHSRSRPNCSGPVERRTVTRRSAYGPWTRRAGPLPTASAWAYPAARTAWRTRRSE
ncbi:hypothetical protein Sgou_44750 [Streptomyces gougerotii]|uniref:Uncharacterized protein n=1 Tax=Streptomyces gougerotii TaxID=53448 RepID=A0ABQ1DB72_9ACTN|nr:hypothetical protein Sgou_44750 [Streptomyces gougerotii]